MSEHPVNDLPPQDIDGQEEEEALEPQDALHDHEGADAVIGEEEEEEEDDYEDDEFDPEEEKEIVGDEDDEEDGLEGAGVNNGNKNLTELLLADPNTANDGEDDDEDDDDVYVDEQSGSATATKKRPIDEVAEEGAEKDAKKVKA